MRRISRLIVASAGLLSLVFVPAGCSSDSAAGGGSGTADASQADTSGGVADGAVGAADAGAGGSDGAGAGPVVDVSVDADVLDLGTTAAGESASGTITLTNAGDDVTVGVEITGSHAGEFDASPAEDTLLASGDSLTIDITFTNDGADLGIVEATLRLTFDGGDEVQVTLKAAKIDGTTCVPTIAPSSHEFGLVKWPDSPAQAFTLTNDGDGACLIESLRVARCLTATNCKLTQISPVYAVEDGPANGDLIEPGASVTFDVTFTPPEPDPTPEGNSWYGVIQFSAESTGSGVIVETANEDSGANVTGTAVLGELQISPNNIVYGSYRVGCEAPGQVQLTNKGGLPIDITAIELDGCANAFTLTPETALPVTLTAGDKLKIAVLFAPGSPGNLQCQARIVNSLGPDEVVDLAGGGFDDGLVESEDGTIQTDETQYGALAADMVDLLFVIDDSGSMGEEQENLSGNFQAVLDAAIASEVDFQIAVTTTDMEDTPGALFGDPLIITAETADLFSQNVQVGVQGSANEQGLAAAEAALKGPMKEFLRAEAPLVIVFVSDEEDHSDHAVDDYVAGYLSVKADNPELVSAHAIVGPKPNGCSSIAGDAQPGFRYIDAAEQVGGYSGSICAPGFGESLALFAEGALTDKTTYVLAHPAVDGSLVLTVDGVPCEEGWELDPSGDRVLFDSASPCFPGDGAEVFLAYTVDEGLCDPK